MPCSTEIGVYAPYLSLAIACEKGNRQSIEQLSARLGMCDEEVNIAHINALVWSEGLDM